MNIKSRLVRYWSKRSKQSPPGTRYGRHSLMCGSEPGQLLRAMQINRTSRAQRTPGASDSDALLLEPAFILLGMERLFEVYVSFLRRRTVSKMASKRPLLRISAVRYRSI